MSRVDASESGAPTAVTCGECFAAPCECDEATPEMVREGLDAAWRLGGGAALDAVPEPEGGWAPEGDEDDDPEPAATPDAAPERPEGMPEPAADPDPAPIDGAPAEGGRATRRAAALAALWGDFPGFCSMLQYVDLDTHRRRPMELTWIQRAYCRRRTKRDIILKARRVFMTSLELARDLWWFLTVRGARVVIVIQTEEPPSPVRTQVRSILRTYIASLRALGIAIDLDVEADDKYEMRTRDATLQIVVAGGTEQAAIAKGRGTTINRLHLSEVAFYQYALETSVALINAMPQSPDAQSETVMESTANGAGGYFFDQWHLARRTDPAKDWNGYAPHFYPWHSHEAYRIALDPGEVIEPRGTHAQLERELLKVVSPEQLKWWRRKLASVNGNLDMLNQEFPSDEVTCFLVGGRNFFDKRRLEEDIASSKTAPPLDVGPDRDERGALRVWARPEPGKAYVVGADTSPGGGGDPSAAIVIERGTGRHVATLHGQFVPRDYAAALVRVARWYNGAKLAVERNESGGSVLQALDLFERAGALVWWGPDGKPGWHTNTASRPVMLDALDAAHRKHEFRTSDLRLLEEMRTFVIDKNGKPEAMRGKHDDLVIAAAIAWSVAAQSASTGVTVGGYVAGADLDDRPIG